MELMCDNQAVIHTASSTRFHEDKTYWGGLLICSRKALGRINYESLFRIEDQLVDLSTKPLGSLRLTPYVTSLEHMICILQLENEC